VVLGFHGRAHRLSVGHYGVISKGVQYTLFNPGREQARIFDISAPQPKSLDHDFKETIFQPGPIVKEASAPDLEDPRIKYLGRLDESQMAGGGGFISAAGARSTSIHGITLKELVDGVLGAHYLSLFMVQFRPGGAGTTHDHPFEEIYFFVSGNARLRAARQARAQT
jgi:mannose-6-phosphate isomerase-like protein (cupin superfamily)